MGVYVVTGGSGGIGGKTSEFLRAKGHEIINIDTKGGDISANLAEPAGRQEAINEIFARCPEGIDGLVCVAGVSGSCGNLELVISLNYFGAVELAVGLYELLQKKHGSICFVSSNTVSQAGVRTDLVSLLNNDPVEEEIRKLVAGCDAMNPFVGQSIYSASKYALARWGRRISASWAANGVRVNSVAPGNVLTPMTKALTGSAKAALSAIPIPTKYGTSELMKPEEIAQAITFLVSPEAGGINGVILFVDGGTDALLNSEKVY